MRHLESDIALLVAWRAAVLAPVRAVGQAGLMAPGPLTAGAGDLVLGVPALLDLVYAYDGAVLTHALTHRVGSSYLVRYPLCGLSCDVPYLR